MKTKISQWARSLAAMAAVLTLAGCAPFQAGDATIRDIIEIRQNVAKNSETLSGIESKLTYSMNSNEKLKDDVTQRVQSSLESTNQQLKEQQKLIDDMRNQLITANAMLAKLTGGAYPATQPTQPIQPVTQPTGDDAPQALTGASPAVSAFNTGADQFKAGTYPQALQSFQMALGQNPSRDQKVEIQYWQAVTFQKAGDTKAAEEAFLGLIKEYQTEPRAWDAVERVADVYRQIKNYDRALDYLNLIVERYPDFPNLARVKAAIEQVKAEKAVGH